MFDTENLADAIKYPLGFQTHWSINADSGVTDLKGLVNLNRGNLK